MQKLALDCGCGEERESMPYALGMTDVHFGEMMSLNLASLSLQLESHGQQTHSLGSISGICNTTAGVGELRSVSLLSDDCGKGETHSSAALDDSPLLGWLLSPEGGAQSPPERPHEPLHVLAPW